jgi:hypothetical protein
MSYFIETRSQKYFYLECTVTIQVLILNFSGRSASNPRIAPNLLRLLGKYRGGLDAPEQWTVLSEVSQQEI